MFDNLWPSLLEEGIPMTGFDLDAVADVSTRERGRSRRRLVWMLHVVRAQLNRWLAARLPVAAEAPTRRLPWRPAHAHGPGCRPVWSTCSVIGFGKGPSPIGRGKEGSEADLSGRDGSGHGSRCMSFLACGRESQHSLGDQTRGSNTHALISRYFPKARTCRHH